MLWLRPSRVLGLFFGTQLTLLLLLAWWQKMGDQWLLLNHAAPQLTNQNWLVLAGIEAAVMGWCVTSFMTLRNSIKQHTINTLLQARLSATYMLEAGVVNKTFFPPTELSFDPVPLEYFKNDDHFDAIKSVNYILNYFEFMSVAIRHGDLDEKLLKSTVRGILVRFYERMQNYIKFQRGDDGTTVTRPRQLEHLTWLYDKWKD